MCSGKFVCFFVCGDIIFDVLCCGVVLLLDDLCSNRGAEGGEWVK